MNAELAWMISEAGAESVTHLLDTAKSIHSCERLAKGIYGNNFLKRERFRAAFRIVWTSKMEAGLSPAQLRFVKLMARGMRMKEVASEMGISYCTAQTMVQHINRRLNTRTIVEAVAKLAGYNTEVKP